MSSQKVITAAFRNTATARSAVYELEIAGIPHSKISALVSENAKEEFTRIETHTKASQGAAIGGATGIALGALAAGLTAVAGIAAPVVGLSVAGPLVAALTGAGAGAAVGGAVGGLVGLGMTEHEAKFHTAVLKNGGTVLIVQTDDKDEQKKAKDILSRMGDKYDSSEGQVAHTV